MEFNKKNNNVTMIELAKAVLDKNKDDMHFNDILSGVAEYLDLSDQQIEAEMATFYTDLNTEGAFISKGNNTWGLRDWYPIDSVNEAIIDSIDEDDYSPAVDSSAYDEEEKAEKINIVDVNLDDDDGEYEESAENTKEISEYEEELSELEVEDEASLNDEDLDYDEDLDDE